MNVSRQKRYTENDICHESKTTVKHVTVCHKNIETPNDRSDEKNCSRYQPCAGRQLVYHCVKNGAGLVEVCAPITPITGNVCPYYEKTLGRVIENYNIPCIMCPFYYLSDNIFEQCVTLSETNEDSSDKTSPVRVSHNKTKYETTEKPVVMSENNILKKNTEKHDDQHSIYLIVIVVLASVCCSLFVIILFKYKNRRCLTTSSQENGFLKPLISKLKSVAAPT